MGISKKLTYKLIDNAKKLIPSGTRDSIQTALRDVDIDFDNIDLDSGTKNEKWARVVELADNNNKIKSLISALIISNPGNHEIKQIKKDFEDQTLESTIAYLKEIISTDQCVLFLGPEILLTRVANKFIPFYKYLATEFVAELDKLEIYYDKDQLQNLSYLIDRYETKEKFVLGQTEKFAKNVYSNCVFDDSLFQLIASLNFSLIINANYDTKLKELFPQKYLSSYYNLSELSHPQFPLANKATGQCLIYNVYGSFENHYSIVLNEKDSVDYTRKVYEKNPSIPSFINEQVKRSYGFFVGFDFNEWHLKILFDILSLEEKPDNFSFLDFTSNVAENQREYFERQFDMTFIKNSVEGFFRLLQ
jgi:SIR2-like domain